MVERKHLNSLRRGLQTLSILNIEESLTGSELAKQLGIPRTTAHRILETLAHEGYVTRIPERHAFRLSAKVRHIAFGFNRDGLLAETARPLLRALCQDTLMPAGLTTPVGPQMVTQVATDHEAPLALEVTKEGTGFPLTQGASGHVFLAHCTQAVRDALLAAAKRVNLESQANLLPTNIDLTRIRRQGYALSPARAGWPEGLIAVPVYLNGEYIASAHLRYMRRVLTEAQVIERLLPKLALCAAEIERQFRNQITSTPELFRQINGPLLVSSP